MGGYVANFMVYTMAMTGLICFAVFVYKKIMDGSLGKRRTNCIEIEDTMNLNPRKTLHVIRVGGEKFLIASDIDRTTLISKLNGSNRPLSDYEDFQEANRTFRNTMEFAQHKQAEQKQSGNKVFQRVHLEPVRRGIGISNIRHSMDMRAVSPVQKPAPVQKTVQKPVQMMPKKQSPAMRPSARPVVRQPEKAPVVAANSTIKDMAKKINEL